MNQCNVMYKTNKKFSKKIKSNIYFNIGRAITKWKAIEKNKENLDSAPKKYCANMIFADCTFVKVSK